MKKSHFTEKKSLHIAVLIVLGLIIFSKSISYDFVWDDEPLYLNPTNYPENSRLENLSKFWTPGEMPMYAPITFTAWGIIASISSKTTENDLGLEPGLFHAANLIFHILNSILIYLILFVLFKESFVSLIAASIFLLHPIQVESTVWISEFRGILSGFFGFLSLLLYVRDRRRKDSFKLSMVIAWVLFLFILSFLSKPSGIVFPAICLVIDFFFFKSDKKQKLQLAGIFLGISLPLVLVSVSAESEAGKVIEAGLFSKLLFPFDSFTFYLQNIVIPINLTAVYGRTAEFLQTGSQFYIFAAISICIAVLSIVFRKILTEYIPGLLISFIAILPTSGLIAFYYQTFSNVADRYFYIGMFGIVLIAATILNKTTNRNRYILSIFTTVLLFVLTSSQINSWANEYSHWDNVIKNSSVQIPQAYMGRGEENLRLNEYQKAIDDFSKSIEINPNEPLYYYNRANAYLDIGRYKESIQDYSFAIRLSPNFINAYINRGMAYSSIEQPETAIKDFLKAYELNQNQVDVCNSIGVSFAQIGKFDSAEVYFRKAVEINPNDVQALDNLKRIETEITNGEKK